MLYSKEAHYFVFESVRHKFQFVRIPLDSIMKLHDMAYNAIICIDITFCIQHIAAETVNRKCKRKNK